MAHHDNPAHVGIRTKTHKLIYYYGCNYVGGYQTPPGWELYDLVNDPHETRNLYHDTGQVKLVEELKGRLAATRQRVGDDGSHYPKCESMLQEFWDYDEADQAKAREISHQYRQRRLEELKAGQRNVPTWR
jgi:N-acetylglucosamine-6-sulfatase